MAFDLLQIKRIEEKELDVAIKSTSANGLVKTRMPYTKVRKSFKVSPISLSTAEEFNELYMLYTSVRTVMPFLFDHPTIKTKSGNPVQYNVRFTEPIVWSQDASNNNYYQIEDFNLEEV